MPTRRAPAPASRTACTTAPTTRAALRCSSRGEPQQRHLQHRLENDRAAHLRRALRPVDEDDGDLLDAKSFPEDAVCRLDLERIALRLDRVEVERLEHLPSEALEPARQVADAYAEQ